MIENQENLIINRDIVIIGLQSWDEPIGSNCIDLAKEFSKKNRVLYVNLPLNRKDLFIKATDSRLQSRIKVLRGKSVEIQEVDKVFWVLTPRTLMEPTNWIKISFLFDLINWINNFKLYLRIRNAIKVLEFSNIILFNDQDFYKGYFMKELMKPTSFIYYIRDNLIKTEFFNLHGSRLEPKLISKADLVVTNSVYLQNYALSYSSRVYYIGQGCDLTLFNPKINYEKPLELKDISRPIIGYVGALVSNRLDLDLLDYLVDRFQKLNFVFVGPEDENFKNSSLHKRDNVFFLGSKPIKILPSFIQFFDVCINPQILNDFTIGNYPRKIDEYLSMGKPVVAKKTITMDSFKDNTYLAVTYQDFAILIEEALNEDNSEKFERRRRFAASHTWSNSYHDLCQAFKMENLK